MKFRYGNRKNQFIYGRQVPITGTLIEYYTGNKMMPWRIVGMVYLLIPE